MKINAQELIRTYGMQQKQYLLKGKFAAVQYYLFPPETERITDSKKKKKKNLSSNLNELGKKRK